MDNCLKHRKDIAGISDMHLLGEAIGDLHYQSLSELLINLAAKIAKDAKKDELTGKEQLAKQLTMLSTLIYAAEQHALNAWHLSKPFMNQNK